MGSTQVLANMIFETPKWLTGRVLGRPEKWESGESSAGLNLFAGVQSPRGTGQTETRLRHLRDRDSGQSLWEEAGH